MLYPAEQTDCLCRDIDASVHSLQMLRARFVGETKGKHLHLLEASIPVP